MKLTMKRGSDHMPSKQDSNSSMPTTDEELQKNMVGELKPHNAPIAFVDQHFTHLFPGVHVFRISGFFLREKSCVFFL